MQILLRVFVVLMFLLSACADKPYTDHKKITRHSTPVAKPVTEGKTYKVIGVKDGDTFVLLVEEAELVVRLAHIDCPEKKQPFGSKAKEFAAEQCFGKYVTLLHQHQYDRNRRLIAEVILENGVNLNKRLIENGLAWHYKKYSDDNEYAALEIKARTEQAGLWTDKDPIAPWLWRHR